MTMQHRIYDCYWQMRMPELAARLRRQRGADRLSGQDRPRAARSPRPASSAEREDSIMKKHRTRHCRRRPARRRAALGAAEARGRSGARSTPRSRRHSRPRRPTGSRGCRQDETMRQCSAHRNNPPKAVADAIQKREKATHRISGRRQVHRRLEEGRGDRANRLRPALHRLSAAQSATAAIATPATR